MITSSSKWLETIHDFSIRRTEAINIELFVSLFLQDCIKNGIPVMQFNARGIASKRSKDKVKDLIKSNSYVLLSKGFEPYEEDSAFELYYSAEGLVQICDGGNFIVNTYVSNEKFLNELIKICKKFSGLHTEVDHIYVMVQERNSLVLHSLGAAASKLIASNYKPNVIEKFNNAVKELKNKDPHGRLLIMDGPPGTGKSFLIRSLMKELPNGIWVFIPSELASQLSGPSLLPVLIREKENNKPIYLVIEDADECLVKRGTGNFSAISTLLNTSSGMLGDMIDVRIVCTTNTPIDELDSAILRDGRLLERIDVNELTYEETIRAYRALAKKDPEPEMFQKNNNYTIANVYALLKKGSSHKPDKPKRQVGFVSAP